MTSEELQQDIHQNWPVHKHFSSGKAGWMYNLKIQKNEYITGNIGMICPLYALQSRLL